ncbi:hypothetical protein GWI33_018175 [Rhynchophorus ferrugineus]|uniref:Microtubule-associated protein n=1 Tax=Rhynchophorus ferrugineus TaxID=354439 RepID=A0A834M5M8_RHYFE|nr:hypothetical protein GWI33_018175 [Rhynchophorus ferrugineus]
MSQQNLANGPTSDGNPVKIDPNLKAPSAKSPTDLPSQNPPPPTGSFLARPPLNRADSRQNIAYRPPFPNIQSGPQSFGSIPNNSGPQSILAGLGSPRPPQQLVRQPPPSTQFVQRGPPVGSGGNPPPRGGPVPGGGFPQGQQQRPIFRPQTPYPRPPLLAQRPQIYQQSSVPAFRPKTTLEESLNRSQTLDTSEFDVQKHGEGSKSPVGDQRPPSVASLGRSASGSSSGLVADQKRSNGSQESINMSRQGSMESVISQKKTDDQSQSRPGSRPASRMDIIDESKITEGNGSQSPGVELPNGNNTTANSSNKEPSPNEVPQGERQEISQPSDKPAFIDQASTQKSDLDLKLSQTANKGDNDSGVDESTQGNDQSCNGDTRSPRTTSKSRTSSTTPTKGRSLSRGSKTPSSLQSPDSAATTPGSADKKKVPMNKVQVGAAPSPNLKVVKSKIGSLDNANYKPGGGRVKIENKKLDFKHATPRIEAKNDKYVPKGGERKEIESARSVRSARSPRKEIESARSVRGARSPRKIISQKLEWNAKSKIGSLENATYKPKGGDKKIETVKLDFKEKAKPKVGSKDNMKHQPGGGDVKIENKKLEVHATSKVGSMDNVKHKPSGGDKKIFDDKDYLKQQKSGKSSIEHSLSGSQDPSYQSIQSQEAKAPVADENLNQQH